MFKDEYKVFILTVRYVSYLLLIKENRWERIDDAFSIEICSLFAWSPFINE